jgi:hypothetical protein
MEVQVVQRTAKGVEFVGRNLVDGKTIVPFTRGLSCLPTVSYRAHNRCMRKVSRRRSLQGAERPDSIRGRPPPVNPRTLHLGNVAGSGTGAVG